MKGSLKLVKVSGIQIKIHWTFLFIIAWVAFMEISRGGTFESVLFNIALVLVVFICVVLHELGHSLTAKRFGVKTKNITLLPIGGVASLDRIPEDPKQELLVAVAGPMVNVVIALILYFALPVKSFLQLPVTDLVEKLNVLDLGNFLFYLFLVNVGLVVFNMIPAFPMDGGRVLRAILAMRTDRVRATQIAASVGQVIAVIFLFLGMLFNPFLILIALFVFIGAFGENKMVQQLSLLKGHTVQEALLTQITYLRPEDTMARVVELILSGTEKDFVVAEGERPVGVLYNRDIIKNSNNRAIPVKKIMKADFKVVPLDKQLTDILRLVETERTHFFPVVSSEQKLLGAVDMTNISEFILLQSKLSY